MLQSLDVKVRWSETAAIMYRLFGGNFNKSPKAIRERWLNHLSPLLKEYNK